jgi:serine/threonine protein kinase
MQPLSYESQTFEKQYKREGQEGYKKFLSLLASYMDESLKKHSDVPPEQLKEFMEIAMKPAGFIENMACNMEKAIWEYLMEHMNAEEKIMLGNPGIYTHKKGLLKTWSDELIMAKTESNVRFANKVLHIGMTKFEMDPKGTRPSRVIPEVRSIHFLKPQQVVNANRVGVGVQGQVYTCRIKDCPLIPPNVTLVAKRFKDGDRHKRRADALQEVLMGGLNHKGIVGALAMTIEDPPRLIYDHYNGGDLGSFIDKCGKWGKSRGKEKMTDKVDVHFAYEKKIFLEHRLGIAVALLETLDFLHQQERFHCDLHFGNVLLHFDYD